jgi:phosphohistidine phosphatase
MPKLLLLRHATAERARPRQHDHERELTKEGRKEAKAIGKKIAALGDAIDLVLSSDSTRTRETWDGVAPSLDEKPKVRFLQSLFEAHDYLPIIKAEGGKAETILVIGHNPTIQETAIELAASLAGRDGTRLRSGFPKGAVAVFEFDGEWSSLRAGQMKLTAFIEADER